MFVRDTTNLYTEREAIRSYMLLRTLISEINQHRDGGRSLPGTAPIKRLPTALKQAALPEQGRGWPMITSASTYVRT